MKDLIILGSTGSIGTQALDTVRQYPEKLNVLGLCCDKNVELLQKQIDEFTPKYVAVKDKEAAEKLNLPCGTQLFTGDNAPLEIAGTERACVLNSLVGISGLAPTMRAIEAGSEIALANKETLVAGGDLVMSAAKDKGVKILPVDSEHSAIWQCLNRNSYGAKEVEKIILTASGGAFRGKTKEELTDVTVDDALKHPTWNMGVKVTIDSATMMNKGFEVIEASHLFGLGADRIEIVVHKQSVVHSMIRYEDGSIIAQLSYPDMRLPVQLALLYPERGDHCFTPLSFDGLRLDFEMPDLDVFVCLKLALDCVKAGGNATTVLNAANEVAVARFAQRQIKFYDIPYYIKRALDKFFDAKPLKDLEGVLGTDEKVKKFVADVIGRK